MKITFGGLFGDSKFESSGSAAQPPLWSFPAPRWQKCPVCLGVGTVPHDFYTQLGVGTGAGQREKCRSCGGRGIVK